MSAPSALFGFTAMLALTSIVRAAAPANPMVVSKVDFLGPQTNLYPNGSTEPRLVRDVGSQGKLGNSYYQIYADTAIPKPDGSFGYFVANSIAAQTFDPTKVQDYNAPPSLFCDNIGSPYRAHLTQMVSINDTSSVSYYIALGPCANCNNCNGCAVNSGPAIVTTNSSGGQPICSIKTPIWDATKEPTFGGSGTYGPFLDGKIYLYGQISNGSTAAQQYTYVARVFPSQATNANAYEYWNGTVFQSKRLYNANSTANVLGGVSIGSVLYSNYYKRYVMLTAPNGNSVTSYTASAPEGPWSVPAQLWYNSTLGGLFLPSGLTSADSSGKTLLVDLSQFGPNTINVVLRLTFA